MTLHDTLPMGVKSILLVGNEWRLHMGLVEKQKARRDYALKTARTMMGQLGIHFSAYEGYGNHPYMMLHLRERHWGRIVSLLKQRNDESLGRLAACAPEYDDDPETLVRTTSIAEAAGHAHVLSERLSGYELLLKLAVLTIIAAMTDLIREDIAKQALDIARERGMMTQAMT